MTSVRSTFVVLVSGNGGNLQAILDASRTGFLEADVVGVVSDKAGATAIERAELFNVPAIVLEPMESEEREAYDVRLREVVLALNPDLVVLAGFMRILSNEFLNYFPFRVVNLHPALPGELPGTRAIERAFTESRQHRRTHTGIMVHFVPDEGVDNGPVIASEVVPIHAADTLATFSQRMHDREHVLLVQSLRSLCREISSKDKSETLS